MSEYASVEELRDEGVSIDVSDTQLTRVIWRASALIEAYTRRWFYPKDCVFMLDGSGSDILQIGPSIIWIDEVRVLAPDYLVLSAVDELIDPLSLQVYNRHLTQGLTDPDDRNNPKIQYLSSWSGDRRLTNVFPVGFFPRGVQNIYIKGIFGYTEPDNGVTLWPNTLVPVGKTPELIKVACMMLVVRDLLPLADLQGRTEAALEGNVTQHRTRDQSITYGGKSGISTGASIISNPEVRSLLAPFCRPITLGAV
jgi:hypothetical protein